MARERNGCLLAILCYCAGNPFNKSILRDGSLLLSGISILLLVDGSDEGEDTNV